MDRSDMTYTDPGKRDHGYIGKFEGKTGQNRLARTGFFVLKFNSADAKIS